MKCLLASAVLLLCALDVSGSSDIYKYSFNGRLFPSLKELEAKEYFTDLDPEQPTNKNGDPHYMEGIKQKGDGFLKYWLVSTYGKPGLRVSEKLKFSDVGGIISSIQVISADPNGEEGYVGFPEQPKDGGVGYDHANILFKTRRSQGFKYYVIFYGH